MMLNLFNIFDFSTYIFKLNWVSSLLFLMFVPQLYWLYNSRMIYFYNILMMNLIKEFEVILFNKFNKNNFLYFISLFMFIYFNNFLGLFSYIFTSSSHLVFAMTFSISMWLGLFIFMINKNLNNFLLHLVPVGTPFFLMFFMVLIELLSNLMRPFTLSIRLVANMVAGHLLLVLLSSFIPSIYLYIFLLIIQLMLLFLELFVSFIQSYVFSILMLLYMYCLLNFSLFVPVLFINFCFFILLFSRSMLQLYQQYHSMF